VPPATSAHADRAAGRPRVSREGDAGPPAAKPDSRLV